MMIIDCHLVLKKAIRLQFVSSTVLLCIH